MVVLMNDDAISEVIDAFLLQIALISPNLDWDVVLNYPNIILSRNPILVHLIFFYAIKLPWPVIIIIILI